MTDTLMKPLPYQQEAIDKLYKVQARLVGDEMGVGKTVTGIGLDLATREWSSDTLVKYGPTLIIPEKIGLDVWDYHLRAMGIPDEQIVVVDPAKRKAFVDALVTEKRYQNGELKRRPGPRYFVVHWDIISRIDELTEKDSKRRNRIQFAHVIADEVHLAKNRKALRTKALKNIGAEFKTGLSGTPADNKPEDIWSVLNWLYPKRYRSYWRFFETYVDYEQHPTMGYRIPKGPRRDRLGDFHREIEPFYIRRKLLDVVDMPEKVHVQPPISVRLTPAQRKMYNQMEEIGIAELLNGDTLTPASYLAVHIRLQQMTMGTIDYVNPALPVGVELNDDDELDYDFPHLTITTPSPKLDAIVNMIETNDSESFIVFSQFKPFVDMVEAECKRKFGPDSVVKIHGDVKDRDRRSAIDRFQSGTARVFVGTIAAAGKTITLTRAQHVIFADRSWNPSKNAQAEARAWRFGQQNAVRVYDIVAEETVDERNMKKVKRNGKWVNKEEPGRLERIALKSKWISTFLDGVDANV